MLDNLKQDFSDNRKIQAKASALIGDLLDYNNIDEATEEEVENQKKFNKELEKTAQIRSKINNGI